MAFSRAPRTLRKSLIGLGILAAALVSGAGASYLDVCGPFTDVPPALCSFVTELYVLGIAAGTSSTTFSPDAPLTRGHAAALTAKALDRALARGSSRAALGQWWTTTPHYDIGLGLSFVPLGGVSGLAADGQDVWAASSDGEGNGALSRIRASDGRVLESWNVPAANPVLVAMGRVFVGGGIDPTGYLYGIDPTQPPGPVTPLTSPIVGGVTGLAFDGARIWTSSYSGLGSVSIVTPAATTPWPVTTVTAGISGPIAVVFDGTNVWAVNTGTLPGSLLRLDSAGDVLQTVPVGNDPRYPVFDGANIWVPNLSDNSVTVVRASTGTVLATLTGNGMNGPWSAAFDGQRVLIAGAYTSLSVFKAADLSPIASFPLTNGAYHSCSDGIHFWIGLSGLGAVARF